MTEPNTQNQECDNKVWDSEILAGMESMLQDLTLEQQVQLLTDMLKARKMSEAMRAISRGRRAEARRIRYRLDVEHREHVLEMKRDRCNWRYEHDSDYCDKIKEASRKRAAADRAGRDLRNALFAQGFLP